MDNYNNINDDNSREKIYMNIAGDEHKKEPYYRETVKCEGGRHRKGSGGFKRAMALCVVASVLGGGSIGAGFAGANAVFNAVSVNSEGAGEPPSGSQTSSQADGGESAAKASAVSVVEGSSKAAIKKAARSVVNIVTTTQGRAQNFMGYSIPFEGRGAGSGIIFSEDENTIAIATNAHVVDSATTIGITIDESTDAIPARLVGEDSTADLAVISVNKSDIEGAGIDLSSIAVAEFESSAGLEVGDTVIAIGNALGEGKSSTRGIISALGKKIQVDGKNLEVIQTDAAINEGNSGGALVNDEGNIIGINTAKAFSTSVEGMGYALPSDVVLPIINKLLTEGTAPKPYMGVVCRTITSEMADLIGVPAGVMVEQVVEGSGADAAGIRAGDIITDIGGSKTLTADTVLEAIGRYDVGDKIDVRIIRNGETALNVEVEIMDANNA